VAPSERRISGRHARPAPESSPLRREEHQRRSPAAVSVVRRNAASFAAPPHALRASASPPGDARSDDEQARWSRPLLRWRSVSGRTVCGYRRSRQTRERSGSTSGMVSSRHVARTAATTKRARRTSSTSGAARAARGDRTRCCLGRIARVDVPAGPLPRRLLLPRGWNSGPRTAVAAALVESGSGTGAIEFHATQHSGVPAGTPLADCRNAREAKVGRPRAPAV
jgi:hypothetical protein